MIVVVRVWGAGRLQHAAVPGLVAAGRCGAGKERGRVGGAQWGRQVVWGVVQLDHVGHTVVVCGVVVKQQLCDTNVRGADAADVVKHLLVGALAHRVERAIVIVPVVPRDGVEVGQHVLMIGIGLILILIDDGGRTRTWQKHTTSPTWHSRASAATQSSHAITMLAAAERMVSRWDALVLSGLLGRY